ncbi:MAG: glycosyltransferase family 1 protein, partial [Calditrichia bacterium]|nr:glycosyltransferase family 1 protein [Calditrichia bacterium]
RVFDVPAAGGFVLTDWKESLTDLFDVENELATFKSIEEMNDKISFYYNNPDLRKKIMGNARERVINEHLIHHRMEFMLTKAKEIWG